MKSRQLARGMTVGVGDLAQAAKWRQKAVKQAAKIADDGPIGARNQRVS